MTRGIKMKAKSKLKPCPFCGCGAELAFYQNRYKAQCCFCGASTLCFDDKNMAIKAWNRRTNK